MNVEKLLKERKSVRDFKKGAVDISTLDAVEKVIDAVNKETPDSVMYRLFTNGDLVADRLDSLGGYSGVMIKAPHYVVLGMMDREISTIVHGAFYLEKIVTQISDMGLGSCWVSTGSVPQEVKDELFGSDLGEVNFILAFGQAKGKSIFEEEVFSERKPVSEVVFLDSWGNGADNFILENRGMDKLFNYVRYAPSKNNAQPWRYLVKDDSISIYIENAKKDPMRLIDAGIAMYYFRLLAVRLIGPQEWVMVDENTADVQGDFIELAEFSL
ncbi:MAG: hypothetical protein GXZ11_08000 [Tissierellia bacterium]|nr:hypothetical protein [Tissierellia bacterium]